MSGWDEGQLFFSDPIVATEDPTSRRTKALKDFVAFLRLYRDGSVFTYREQLRRHYNRGLYWIEVELEDLTAFDETLADLLQTQPGEFLPLFEEAATNAADVITHPRPNNDPVQSMQVMLRSQANPLSLRDLGSQYVGKLVKVPGIIVSAATVKAKATHLTLQCRQCRTIRKWPVKPGFGGSQLPRTCTRQPAEGEQKCPLDPYDIVADKCTCVDQQTLKLQETPEMVPTGEMPRHLLLTADRYLTDRAVPGTRCTIIGIFSIFSSKKKGGVSAVGARYPYLRVMGMQTDSEGAGRSQSTFTEEEEEQFAELLREPNIYERVCKSIAPSIFGSEDIKKALACLLFGGSTKMLPDSTRLRGDINVLLLGDPGTAKSQLLKFAERVAPVGVYTSGKGSSAAGLTASVVRDASSREFYLEGGAMVLADGGVVCIDEFDKMRETDRVAIHEAMEQQTISIAKAGITTTLNSRASVFAAANSVFGRWDDTKTTDENIEFQSTILSRFDLIFIVKDEHNEERDEKLARHVMGVHLHAIDREVPEGEIDVQLLKRFIHYCRLNCGPRLSKQAMEKLRNHFVKIRSDTRKLEKEMERRSAIPITVRQLEALVRISESLAKMETVPFVTEHHVEEAIRLFKVSTINAAQTGQIGVDGTEFGMEELLKAEQAVKERFRVGWTAFEQRLIQDFVKQNYDEQIIRRVINTMLRRGELEHRDKRKQLYRIK
eukprot:m.391340 g.391340  ORF g.391340 m.391340 type:complete len:718 (+) comp20080_c0_seq19:195-2348(+)